MSDTARPHNGSVESFPALAMSTAVSDELGRILELLTSEFPQAVEIGFSFSGKLQVHIDVRSLEEITILDAKLPTMAGGLFSEVRYGGTPGHAFLHRVSAKVAR